MTISRFYRPELDVLRFIAFLMVFIVHRMDFMPIDPAQHYWLYNICLLGDLGVPVFFLLSSFLITELLFRESDETGTIQLKAFYMRRILRIWPLYFLVFYGLVILTQFVPWSGAKDPATWLAFTFFAGNWWICLHGWVPAYPVNPLWSVSVEEQFYIAIPIIALYLRRPGVKTVSLFLIAVSYIAVVLYALHPRWLQQPMDEQLRPVPVLRRRNAALDLPERPRPAVASCVAPGHRPIGNWLLAGRLDRLWSPGRYPALNRSREPPSAGRSSWPELCCCFSACSASLPNTCLHPRLPGTHLIRPLSLS